MSARSPRCGNWVRRPSGRHSARSAGLRALFRVSGVLGLAVLAAVAAAQEPAPLVDAESGLVKDEAGVWEATRDHCTECHSAILLTQNRTDRDGWVRTIRRMLEEEGLEPLGEAEDPILDYLSGHYGVQVKPTELKRRRAPLRQPPIGDPP